MGRKRKSEIVPPGSPPLSRRVGELLTRIWKGNATRMARELQVSHPALTRVLNGQMPSGKLLQTLAEHPDVNVVWLLTGEDRTTQGDQRFCQIADSLLDGSPKDRPERLSAAFLPTASLHPIEASYWHRISSGDAIVAATEARVAANDYLLIETSPRWTRRPEAYAGRFCVIQPPTFSSPVLAHVAENEDYFKEHSPREVLLFGVNGEYLLYPVMREALDGITEQDPHCKATPLCLDDLRGVAVQLVRVL